jgi:16S rRNA (adenine1518-N6/adenine1519-N6)-dimethyltransferase
LERRILDTLHLQPTDVILEIGAGPGNMTAGLAERAGKVVAVELDPAWAERTRARFAEDARVSVLKADILKISISDVACRFGVERLRVFGNLPYYITTPCLLHLFRYCETIEEITVMVQREVADRITSQPGSKNYGLLTVTCQYYTRPEMLFVIPPSAFRHPPKVQSALVRMLVSPRGEELGVDDEKAFWIWMRAAFAQRRKTLANNWRNLCDSGFLRTAMDKQGIDARARAEALSLFQLAALYRILNAPCAKEGV